MADRDLIIVGGGIAGSTVARIMAEQGFRVLVLEQEKIFNDRVRGEGRTSGPGAAGLTAGRFHANPCNTAAAVTMSSDVPLSRVPPAHPVQDDLPIRRAEPHPLPGVQHGPGGQLGRQGTVHP